uniref:Uncharacterized protein n=1 Tax=Arundo donax TaxID=35708 RepID=A0A0A9ASW0_ARUDO
MVELLSGSVEYFPYKQTFNDPNLMGSNP